MNIPNEITRHDLIKLMEQCPQNERQNVLQHGRSVLAHYKILMSHLRGEGDIPEWWRLPKWASLLTDCAYSDEITAEYAEFHDCGKPFCRIIDENGKQHFPDHAAISEKIWLAAGGNPIAARLIGMDMDAHLLTPETIPEFASRPEAPTLLLMAIAETHSNAAMFGGIDSDSFKIKIKKLDKRGGQAAALLLQNNQP
jgi:hypothetical protein